MMSYRPIDGVQVIGVTGASRAGKDSLAMALIRLVPGAERMAFSDLLAARMRLEGRMGARDPRAMQDEGARASRPALLAAMYHAIEDRRPRLAIITGVRKQDEADMIRQMGGTVIRVVRTEQDGKLFQADDRDPDHPVEREIASLGEDVLVAAPSGDLDTLTRFACVYVGDVLGVPCQVP